MCIVVYDGHNKSWPVETTVLDKDLHPDGFTTITNEEGSFGVVGSHAMLFSARCFAATPGADQEATRDYYTGVHFALHSGDRPMDRIRTGTKLLNRPEALTTLWKIDFESDPTADDRNLDDTDDWVSQDDDGDVLDVSDLLGDLLGTGTTAVLTTNPSENFSELTTVEISMHALQFGEDGPRFDIHVDRDSGYAAGFRLALDKASDETQTLKLFEKEAYFLSENLIGEYSQLQAGEIDVRLLIDPDLNTINLKVNGVHQDTFSYDPVVAIGTDASASITTRAEQGEFSYLRIRVGGNP